MKLNLKPDSRMLAQFAWTAFVAFPLLAALFTRGDARWYQVWAWQWSHPVVLAMLALGTVQLVLFLAGATALTRALFVVLTVVAYPIGFVLSHVLLGTIFYLVVTPIGLAFRLLGRDTMPRRPDGKLATYWRERGPQRPPADYFKLY